MTSDDPLLRPQPEGIEQRPVTAASRVLLGGPVILLTTSWRGRPNVMPLAWHMPLSADPPLLGVSIEQTRYTAEIVSHSQEFALNVPTRPLLHHVQYLGSMRGEDIDKFEATQLETFTATHVTAPLIVGCAAWVECEVQDILPFGDHVLAVGLPVAVRVDPRSFTDRWHVQVDRELRALHFLGGHHYSSLDGLLEARLPRDFEAPERVLRERLAEELELTREARERREERLGEIERDVERGRTVDPSLLEEAPGEEEHVELPPGVAPDDALDLSKGIIFRSPDES